MDTLLTKRERDCLIAIGDNSAEFPIRLVDLSRIMHIKPPSAIEILKKLEKYNFVARKDGMVVLTADGMEEYHKLLTSHRLFETLFVRMGIDEEKACEEVSSFDFMMEEKTVMDIMAGMGMPKVCPHGKPISDENMH
ncbi:metal-dependent transcriptional regulator [Oxyplasma meridianum]|uniref:Metal-dependent transcriptional regulator n=1 Tax=Oxyplasma meridianum TaxID=3073602 RepID=A0AAX4NF79_9ARCH